MNLVQIFQSLKTRSGTTISIIGSGGKTTLMFKLSHILKTNLQNILVSTTTKIKIPERAQYSTFLEFSDDFDISSFDLKNILSKNQSGNDSICQRGSLCKSDSIFDGSSLSKSGSLCEKGSICVIGKTLAGEGKMSGPPLSYLPRLSSFFDYTLLEADGSKGKSLKGWKDYEPVVVPQTDITIAVLGFDVLGKSITEDTVHRTEEFLKITAANYEDLITLEHFKSIATHKNGLFQHAKGKTILLINKVHTPNDFINSKILAKKLFQNEHLNLDAIIIGSLSDDYFQLICNPQLEPNISAIIMASGFSSRMGVDKLQISFRGKPLLSYVLDLVSHINFKSKVIVYRDNSLLELIKKFPIKAIFNNGAAGGQSESIKRGIINSPDSLGYIFFTGDQPFLNINTVNLLLKAFENNPKKIIIPIYKQIQGNPVIFPSIFKEELLGLSGDVGGRSIIRNHPNDILKVAINEEAPLMDIDTLNDYYKLLTADKVIIVRGGGDLATGVIHKLWRSGFFVIILELEKPTSIRRKVSFSEAVYDGSTIVEGATAIFLSNFIQLDANQKLPLIYETWKNNNIPVIIDPNLDILSLFTPLAIVDAIVAKKNRGFSKNMAPITIALGPGFEAGVDVHAVVETNRGHNLGRLIFSGRAQDNTSKPGNIGGFTGERVIYSTKSGLISTIKEIGELVSKDDILGYIEYADSHGLNKISITAPIDGLIRGLIRNGSMIPESLKICDIDPRLNEKYNFNSISDKARNIAGGVLEGILYFKNNFL